MYELCAKIVIIQCFLYARYVILSDVIALQLKRERALTAIPIKGLFNVVKEMISKEVKTAIQSQVDFFFVPAFVFEMRKWEANTTKQKIMHLMNNVAMRGRVHEVEMYSRHLYCSAFGVNHHKESNTTQDIAVDCRRFTRNL